MAKPKYLTADELGILPAERKALIAFVEAPALGRIVSVNGKAHYYDQSMVDDDSTAWDNECGTAGCVAGFVFAHVRHVQKLRSVRGARNPNDYIDAACETDSILSDCWDEGTPHVPLLNNLYRQGGEHITLAEARKVVTRALTTGKVKW